MKLIFLSETVTINSLETFIGILFFTYICMYLFFKIESYCAICKHLFTSYMDMLNICKIQTSFLVAASFPLCGSAGMLLTIILLLDPVGPLHFILSPRPRLIYLERERAGWGQRGGRENPKQTPCRAQSPIQGSVS